MKKSKIFKAALIASLYVVLCMVFAPISFGPIQFRISELLCLLSINYSYAVIALTLGCLLSNVFLGGLGIFDIVFGTLATFLACLLAYVFRKKLIKGLPIISYLMIVLVNAVIVGIEFGFIYENINVVPLYMLEIFISEFIIIFLIGMPIYPQLLKILKKFS